LNITTFNKLDHWSF